MASVDLTLDNSMCQTYKVKTSLVPTFSNMFKERENFLSSNSRVGCAAFDICNNYGVNNNKTDFYNSHHFPRQNGSKVTPSLPSSCSGDEESSSISPVNSFCIGHASSRLDSAFSFISRGGRDSLSTMPSPTPEGSGGHPLMTCFGCGQTILARYYVLAMDHHFHTECLKCHLCHAVLSEEPTCFEKEGQILCKQDYFRMYQEASIKLQKHCARCTSPINANDLVMKVRDFVYHVDCFVCSVCHQTFNRGDHFRMQRTDLYCQLHYDMTDNASEESGKAIMPNIKVSSNNNNKRGRPPKRKLLGGVPENFKDVNASVDYFHPASKPPGIIGLSNVRSMSAEFNQIMDSPINSFNMSPLAHGRSGEISSGIPPMNGEASSHQKGKRMRTTFKHNQLRVMKSYFEMNPNPDTKDLKQLSQKTGLCKRVLQVWFQNARAKHRRSTQGNSPRQDSSLSGGGTLLLEDSEEWSPSHTFGSDSNNSLSMPLIPG